MKQIANQINNLQEARKTIFNVLEALEDLEKDINCYRVTLLDVCDSMINQVEKYFWDQLNKHENE